MQSLLGIDLVLITCWPWSLSYKVVWLLQTFSVYLGLILLLFSKKTFEVGLARAGNFYQ